MKVEELGSLPRAHTDTSARAARHGFKLRPVRGSEKGQRETPVNAPRDGPRGTRREGGASGVRQSRTLASNCDRFREKGAAREHGEAPQQTLPGTAPRDARREGGASMPFFRVWLHCSQTSIDVCRVNDVCLAQRDNNDIIIFMHYEGRAPSPQTATGSANTDGRQSTGWTSLYPTPTGWGAPTPVHISNPHPVRLKPPPSPPP